MGPEVSIRADKSPAPVPALGEPAESSPHLISSSFKMQFNSLSSTTFSPKWSVPF
jgi:hypothetical protein